jgi:D-lactate dehydrogenase
MALLESRAARIAPDDLGEPASDAAPDWVAQGTPAALAAELTGALGADGIATRALDLIRYASDASPYRLIPQAVAIPRDIHEVAATMAVARRTSTPLVFRAGGTSLSGQGQTDGILLDCRRHFSDVQVEDEGARVRVQPGMVLGHVNRRLARHGRRLGPDPASTDIACIGGVLANNSGGMRCGVVADSYSTVRSLTFALPSGVVIDTAAPGAAERFGAEAPELAAGLAQIRDELRADTELAARVARKFEIKNTTGYRLCAFLDADEPLEIFRRLLIGSEGTLAFIGEAVFDTVPLGRHTTLALTFFEDIETAVSAVPELVATGASATELMVAPTLIAAAWNMPGTPERWKELPPNSAALLVEFRAEAPGELDDRERAALEILAARSPIDPPRFTREREEVAMLWHVREGMQGLLAAMRGPGISLIIEDVCVPPRQIAQAAADLQELLGKHGFLTSLAGHASAGNLHFLLTPNFGEQADLDRYEAFMGELVDLVVDRYDGSLKAEHGTGVNMAHYVEREWGAKATEMMWRIKRLADPDGLLGPGVLLTGDEGAHLRNLKSAPQIEPEVNQCIECGFCEPVCPSRDLTTTPRQRIALRREMARQPAGSPLLQTLLEQYQYDAIETCAADGTCALSCPVGIDTGKFVKQMRTLQHDQKAQRGALQVAKHWAGVERGARGALRTGRRLGDGPMSALTGLTRSAVGHELVPAWGAAMPGPAPPLPWTAREGATAVYFPACVNRIFGNPREQGERPSLPEALLTVSARAGQPLWIPEDVAGNCCATPWSSKGYGDGHQHMARRVAAAAIEWTENGRLPLVVDASSCTLGLLSEVPAALDDAEREAFEHLTILDSIAWVHDHLLGSLELHGKAATVALHPPCAASHLGLVEQLGEIAAALAEEVVTAPVSTCCGTAGDRGLLHPELPAAANRDSAAVLAGARAEACLCSNRTCEIGLTQSTGHSHGSFVLLLEELTRPGSSRAT